MVNLLKNVGKGILYILGSPFFVLVMTLAAILGIFIIIITFIKSIILFFTGRSLDDELPEDKRAREIKQGIRPEPQPVPARPQPVIQEQPTVTVTPTVAPKEEPKVTREVVRPVEEEEIEEEEPEPVEEPEEEEEVINPAPKEINGTYVPHTSKGRFVKEEDEDIDDDSGVTITFGDDDDDK